MSNRVDLRSGDAGFLAEFVQIAIYFSVARHNVLEASFKLRIDLCIIGEEINILFRAEESHHLIREFLQAVEVKLLFGPHNGLDEWNEFLDLIRVAARFAYMHASVF